MRKTRVKYLRKNMLDTVINMPIPEYVTKNDSRHTVRIPKPLVSVCDRGYLITTKHNKDRLGADGKPMLYMGMKQHSIEHGKWHFRKLKKMYNMSAIQK
jgi:hypothetical protein